MPQTLQLIAPISHFTHGCARRVSPVCHMTQWWASMLQMQYGHSIPYCIRVIVMLQNSSALPSVTIKLYTSRQKDNMPIYLDALDASILNTDSDQAEEGTTQSIWLRSYLGQHLQCDPSCIVHWPLSDSLTAYKHDKSPLQTLTVALPQPIKAVTCHPKCICGLH